MGDEPEELSFKTPLPSKIGVRVSWPAPRGGSPALEVDVSCVCFDKDGKLAGSDAKNDTERILFYNTAKKQIFGGNIRILAEDGGSTSETIIGDLSKLPGTVHYIFFAVSLNGKGGISAAKLCKVNLTDNTNKSASRDIESKTIHTESELEPSLIFLLLERTRGPGNNTWKSTFIHVPAEGKNGLLCQYDCERLFKNGRLNRQGI